MRNLKLGNTELAIAYSQKICYNTPHMSENLYISRHLEPVLSNAAETFKVVILCGSRQVGKSTLMKHFLSNKGVRMVSLDNPGIRSAAINDPELFLAQYEPPLMIDEFQYAPELLPFIKMVADGHDEPGLYFLTGSQLFKMMDRVGESLAGRAAVLSLSSLSQAEITGCLATPPFLPSEKPASVTPATLREIQEAVFRGGMPALVCGGERMNRDLFFSSYVQTYIERDIRKAINIRNIGLFKNFLACVASRTGEELVYDDIASNVGIDSKTAKSWIGVLEATGLVFLLHSWSGNPTKRIVKRPKLHFMDSGLACHLARISDASTLFASRQAGHFFESWVIGQIVRSYQAAGLDPSHYLYYYRDDALREIDLVISRFGKLYPVEIKLSANPDASAMKHFTAIDQMGVERATGCVLSLSQNVIPVRDRGFVVNVSTLWKNNQPTP